MDGHILFINELMSLNIYYKDFHIVSILINECADLESEFLSDKTDQQIKYEKKVVQQFEEYFSGERTTFDLEFRLEGTDFQVKVWQALQNIPYGETRSYKDIAESVDSPKAYRAVGMANNKNKIPIIIPCHRVIGSKGQLVGYAGGLNIKKILLDLEEKYM